MKRTTAELDPQASSAAPEPPPPITHPTAAARGEVARGGASYAQDLEDRYVAARDAWTHAMHAANSGRPADMASLAIAQEAYEVVADERERWIATGHVAIPIQPSEPRHDIEIAVGQEVEWRRVHEHQPKLGLMARIRRRLGGG